MELDAASLWTTLIWPMTRLVLGLAAGLFIANVLEAMRWTEHLARWGIPLARLANLGKISASAFTLAFISPASANGLLAENHAVGNISDRELMLANLFNALPAFFAHTPTIFFLMWPALGIYSLIYVGLTFVAAIARTIFTIFLGRMFLPRPEYASAPGTTSQAGEQGWKTAPVRAWKRFAKRAPRLVVYTVPVYILMYVFQESGAFGAAERWMADNLGWLAIIRPQAMGIVLLQIVAEMGSTIAAAGAVLENGALSPHDIIIALLSGNVLATPLRAIRHQLPSYAGFFSPGMAVRLVIANQGLRAASMIVIIACYAMVFA